MLTSYQRSGQWHLTNVSSQKQSLQPISRNSKSSLDLDVTIVGAGRAGLTAAYLLARDGFNVAVFERKLSVGGGMWGGECLLRIVPDGPDFGRHAAVWRESCAGTERGTARLECHL